MQLWILCSLFCAPSTAFLILRGLSPISVDADIVRELKVLLSEKPEKKHCRFRGRALSQEEEIIPPPNFPSNTYIPDIPELSDIGYSYDQVLDWEIPDDAAIVTDQFQFELEPEENNPLILPVEGPPEIESGTPEYDNKLTDTTLLGEAPVDAASHDDRPRTLAEDALSADVIKILQPTLEPPTATESEQPLSSPPAEPSSPPAAPSSPPAEPSTLAAAATSDTTPITPSSSSTSVVSNSPSLTNSTIVATTTAQIPGSEPTLAKIMPMISVDTLRESISRLPVIVESAPEFALKALVNQRPRVKMNYEDQTAVLAGGLAMLIGSLSREVSSMKGLGEELITGQIVDELLLLSPRLRRLSAQLSSVALVHLTVVSTTLRAKFEGYEYDTRLPDVYFEASRSVILNTENRTRYELEVTIGALPPAILDDGRTSYDVWHSLQSPIDPEFEDASILLYKTKNAIDWVRANADIELTKFTTIRTTTTTALKPKGFWQSVRHLWKIVLRRSV